MAVHRPHRVFVAGRELPHLLHELRGEAPAQGQDGLDGNVFAEGDEADLVVAQDDVARRIEHLGAHPDAPRRIPALLAVVVAEKQVEPV